MQNIDKNETKVVYTVDDIKNMLGIGKDQAYKLVNSGEFHVCHVGKKIIVPKILFDNWFLGNDGRQNLQNRIVS